MLAHHGRVMGVVGGLFLLWTAARTALRRRTQADGAVRLSPLAAYASAVVFNATNPMSLILIVALVSPVASGAPSGFASVLFGLFAAAAGWWVCLTGGVALLRRRISPAVLHHVNQGAAALLTLYGAVTLARAAGL